MEKIKICLSIPFMLMQKIDAYCKEKGYTRTQFIIMVLNNFFE